ncbi:MAG: helix-turn-helix transcriptional regulator [Mariniphaga sp.]
MNYEKIKEYCDDRGISLPELAKKIELTKSGLYLAISKKTITVEKLEKIATELKVPIWYFFDLDPEAPYIEKIEQQKKVNQINQESLEQMTKVIDELKRKLQNIKTVTYFYHGARELVAYGLIEKQHYDVMNHLLLDFLTSPHDDMAVETFVNKMSPIMDTRKKADNLIFMGSASQTKANGPIELMPNISPIDFNPPE